MQALFFALALSVLQASPEAELLWARGRRVEALERMSVELIERPEDQALRASLVARELELSRFHSALEHAQALGAAGAAARGRALYFLGRYEAALEFLSSVDPELVLLRVESLRALGRLAEADALLPSVAELFGPQDPRYRLLVGRKLLREGQHERACVELRAVLEVRPLEAEALFGLGRALIKSSRRTAGLEVLERHRRLLPLLDALDFARRGVSLAPRHAANLAALGAALADLVSLDPTLLAEARAAFSQAMIEASGADLVPIALRTARFRMECEHDSAGAVQLLESALLRQDHVRLRVRAADYLVQAGELSRARAHLQSALSMRPSDPALLERLAKLADEPRIK